MIDFLSRVNWVDLLVTLLVLRTAHLGWRVGLTQESVRVVGMVAAAVVAIHWYGTLGEAIAYYVNLPQGLLSVLAYAALAFGAVIVTGVARFAVERVVKFKFATAWERPGGLVLGLIRGTIMASLILAGGLLTHLGYLERVITEEGYTGPALLRVAPAIHQAAAGVLPESQVDNELTLFAE